MKTISYFDAVHVFGNSFVLCNNAPSVDPSIWESIYFDFDVLEDREIYQFYLCDCSCDDVLYMYNAFGLLFAYSEVLDCFVLMVDHWGTSWHGVMIEDKRI